QVSLTSGSLALAGRYKKTLSGKAGHMTWKTLSTNSGAFHWHSAHTMQPKRSWTPGSSARRQVLPAQLPPAPNWVVTLKAANLTALTFIGKFTCFLVTPN